MWFKQNKKRIYLDHAAATPVAPVARQAMLKALDLFANPAGIHTPAHEARALLEDARTRIARCVHVRPRQVVFTASATEANNMAILGLPRKGHIITSTIEHASVYEPIKKLEAAGWPVTYIAPTEDGHILAEDVGRAVREDTVLISIMLVQNEIGTVQPIGRIARAVERSCNGNVRPLIHTDAAQAGTTLDIDATALRADLITISSQKVYGPKGAAALIVGSRATVDPRIIGGGQEGGMRAGTENVPAIAGFAAAFEEAQQRVPDEYARLTDLRLYVIDSITSGIADVLVNGNDPVSPHIVNVSFLGISGEQLAIALDVAGIAVSTGSACSSEDDVPQVVARMFGEGDRAESSIRFSFGRATSKKELTRTIEVLKTAVERLRTHARVVGG